MKRLGRAGLSRQEDDVRKCILRVFFKDGAAPDVGSIAAALELVLQEVLQVCRKLTENDLIVWKDDKQQILSAYPFSGLPTVHHVILEGNKTLYAMCAIDALGIPFMIGQGATLESSCFACQKLVKEEIHEGLLKRAEPFTTVVWFSAREGRCVAEARCPLINFFWAEEHLRGWLAKYPHEQGTALSLMKAVEFGKTIFGALLK